MHEGIYIQVDNGVASAQHISLETDDANPELANPLPLQGEAAVAVNILEMLTRYGMTKEEAQGVIDAWAPQWFHAPGRRFLLRMSPGEYDTLCPLTIRPKPTTMVRLGLILTEFDGSEKQLSAQP